MGKLNYELDYPASGFMPKTFVEVTCSDKLRLPTGAARLHVLIKYSSTCLKLNPVDEDMGAHNHTSQYNDTRYAPIK